MADYWLKLYIEILDDPKMAVLPDRVWRRIIELFLVAKRLGKDGHLPDTRQIAWMLRMNADDLEADMAQISTTGIVVREVNGWFIPKFSQRQAAIPDAERKTQERNRKNSQQYYGNVTNVSRNVTQSTEDRVQSTEAEAELPPPAIEDIFSVYENEIGTITKTISDELTLAEKEYPAGYIQDALREASKNNKRSWAYAHAILKRWKVEGKGSNNGKSATSVTGWDVILQQEREKLQHGKA